MGYLPRVAAYLETGVLVLLVVWASGLPQGPVCAPGLPQAPVCTPGLPQAPGHLAFVCDPGLRLLAHRCRLFLLLSARCKYCIRCDDWPGWQIYNKSFIEDFLGIKMTLVIGILGMAFNGYRKQMAEHMLISWMHENTFEVRYLKKVLTTSPTCKMFLFYFSPQVTYLW